MIPAAVNTALWGGLAILYILLLVVPGLIALRNGHWVIFILGFALPLLWLIGALMAPPDAAKGADTGNYRQR